VLEEQGRIHPQTDEEGGWASKGPGAVVAFLLPTVLHIGAKFIAQARPPSEGYFWRITKIGVRFAILRSAFPCSIAPPESAGKLGSFEPSGAWLQCGVEKWVTFGARHLHTFFNNGVIDACNKQNGGITL